MVPGVDGTANGGLGIPDQVRDDSVGSQRQRFDIEIEIEIEVEIGV